MIDVQLLQYLMYNNKTAIAFQVDRRTDGLHFILRMGDQTDLRLEKTVLLPDWDGCKVVSDVIESSLIEFKELQDGTLGT